MNARALVYRGPAALPGCPEAVAALLARAGFAVGYVGPQEAADLSPAALADADLYAQPGGASLRRAFRRLRRHGPVLADYVAAGGRYLGFCLGAYLAGRDPGFALLPGDTDRYIDSPGASVATDADTVLTVRWRGTDREVFFQDGPWFRVDAADAEDLSGGGPARRPDAAVRVLARYDNGLPAALVARHHAGAVGVVGPHPEATEDWFADAGLRPRDATDLGLDLVEELMRS